MPNTSPGFIGKVTPTNLLAEKAAFFASATYNPQFTYPIEIDPSELLSWGTPRPEYIAHAEKMLPLTLSDATPSQVVTASEIEAAVSAFNTTYQVTPPVELIFRTDQVAPCMVGRRKISFKIPLSHSQSEFRDLLKHELETHILRRLNDEQQPWHTSPFPDQEIRRTEEGLAGLHTHLERNSKLFRKSYLSYLAVSLAQQESFRTVYEYLRSVGLSQEMAWSRSVRVKRGLTDTSQSGGLTRDICYLEGAVEVARWILDHPDDLPQLYWGRIGLQHIPLVAAEVITTNLQIPAFMHNSDRYLQTIRTIYELNRFDQLP